MAKGTVNTQPQRDVSRSRDQDTAQDIVFDNFDLSEESFAPDVGQTNDDEPVEKPAKGKKGDEFNLDLDDDNDEPDAGDDDTNPDPDGDQEIDPQIKLATDIGAEAPAGPVKYKVDPKTQNIVDLKGKILAKAGNERRLWQKMTNAERNLVASDTKTKQFAGMVERAIGVGRELKTQLDAANGHINGINQFKLTPPEMTQAMEVFAQIKANPAEGLKKLLTTLAINGINMESLGIQGAGGLDVATLVSELRKEIRSSTAPLAAATQRQTEQDRVASENKANYDRIVNETNNFFNVNSDAVPYAKTFEALLKDPRNKGMTLNEAWLKIQLHLERNPGQKITSNPANNARRSGNRTQRRVPPSGRNRPNGEFNSNSSGDANDAPAPLNQTYKEILNGILDEQGVR